MGAPSKCFESHRTLPSYLLLPQLKTAHMAKEAVLAAQRRVTTPQELQQDSIMANGLVHNQQLARLNFRVS